jgi:antitoxin HigA-1
MRTLREDVLGALGLTVSEAAPQLGVGRITLSRVLHGRAGISVDLDRHDAREPVVKPAPRAA